METAEAHRLEPSGCASIQADVVESAGVGRHLGGGLAPLDIREYSTLEFFLASDTAVEVCVEGSHLSEVSRGCVTVPESAAGAPRKIPLSALRV